MAVTTAKQHFGNMVFWIGVVAAVFMVSDVPFGVRPVRNASGEPMETWGSTRTAIRPSALPAVRSLRGSTTPSIRPPVVREPADIGQVIAGIRARYGHIIREASVAQGVHPIVITAIIYEESKGNPYAVSKKSCKGLTQICNGTAQEFGVRDVFDPRENILGGAKIFAAYRRKVGGSFDRALVAYNAGPYSELFDDPNFDPAQYEYVRRVKRTIAYLSA